MIYNVRLGSCDNIVLPKLTNHIIQDGFLVGDNKEKSGRVFLSMLTHFREDLLSRVPTQNLVIGTPALSEVHSDGPTALKTAPEVLAHLPLRRVKLEMLPVSLTKRSRTGSFTVQEIRTVCVNTETLVSMCSTMNRSLTIPIHVLGVSERIMRMLLGFGHVSRLRHVSKRGLKRIQLIDPQLKYLLSVWPRRSPTTA